VLGEIVGVMVGHAYPFLLSREESAPASAVKATSRMVEVEDFRENDCPMRFV
jgi:hypothetical protein